MRPSARPRHRRVIPFPGAAFPASIISPLESPATARADSICYWKTVRRTLGRTTKSPSFPLVTMTIPLSK